jgi:hypothetical protein
VPGNCAGDSAHCLSGTLSSKQFASSYAAAKVQLHHGFPYDGATPLQEVTVDQAGHFEIGSIPEGTRYYLQGIARFSVGGSERAVARVVGPLSIPNTAGDPTVWILPVTVEAFQARANGTTSLSWGSAHVYDPATAAPLTDADVTFAVGAQSWPMPYGPNLSGATSYFVQLPKGTPGATSLSIRVHHPSLGAETLLFGLTGELPTSDASLTAPADGASLPSNQDVAVSWPPSPESALAVVELFSSQAGVLISRYQSSPPLGPDVVSAIIPGNALKDPSLYVLNLQLAKLTCPSSSDGCVYNASIATANLTVK